MPTVQLWGLFEDMDEVTQFFQTIPSGIGQLEEVGAVSPAKPAEGEEPAKEGNELATPSKRKRPQLVIPMMQIKAQTKALCTAQP